MTTKSVTKAAKLLGYVSINLVNEFNQFLTNQVIRLKLWKAKEQVHVHQIITQDNYLEINQACELSIIFGNLQKKLLYIPLGIKNQNFEIFSKKKKNGGNMEKKGGKRTKKKII